MTLCGIEPQSANLKISQPKIKTYAICFWHKKRKKRDLKSYLEKKKKKRSQKLPIIIKKRTISNFHTNASNAKKLSMMHLLRLAIESRRKGKRNI